MRPIVNLLEKAFSDPAIARSVFQRWIRPRVPARLSSMATDRFGFQMMLDLRQTLDVDCAFGIHDNDEVEFLGDAYLDGTYFVDVGANIGIYSLLFKKRYPQAKILAFEPDPVTMERFKRNVDLNSFHSIQLSSYAVSDQNGPAVLNLNQLGNSANNSLLDCYPPHDSGSVTVECRTLLSALREFSVDRVSAMKIDIEGYEYPVLRRFIAEAPREVWPIALVIEAWGVHVELFGGSPIELLIRHGYKLMNFNHRRANFFFRLEL